MAEINIEKFRELKNNKADFNLNGKFDEITLKTISGKFSCELIFNLDLSNQLLTDISPLKECTNLMLLNLTKNNIKVNRNYIYKFY